MTTNPSGSGLQGLINTAEGFIGGHSGQQATQGAGLNKAIDTAQGYLGHVGQGGTGLHGTVDNFQQSALGNNAISSAIYGGAGYLGGQGAGAGAGAGGQGLLSTAQGLLSGGNANGFSAQPTAPVSLVSKTVDSVQGLMGHHGQGGTGIHGAIDKAQAYFDHSGQQGVAPTQAQGNQGLLNTAQNLLGGGNHAGTQQGGLLNSAQNLLGGGRTAQPATTNQAGGLNRGIDAVQGLMGHHGQGGTGVQGTIDRAQGFLGHTDQAGLH